MSGRFSELVAALQVADSQHDLFSHAIRLVRETKHGHGRVMFIGNGGSAGIASHMAADWMKNGRFATLCFSDPALLTCVSNDLGYDNVYALPIDRHAHPGDLLIAISSSGKSQNILLAANVARAHGLKIITLSGFAPNNELRTLGDANFYVPSSSYGTVEIAHLAILHSILDRIMMETA